MIFNRYIKIYDKESLVFPCILFIKDYTDFFKVSCLIKAMRSGSIMEESDVGIWAARHEIGGFQMIYPLQYGISYTLIKEYIRQRIYYIQKKKSL